MSESEATPADTTPPVVPDVPGDDEPSTPVDPEEALLPNAEAELADQLASTAVEEPAPVDPNAPAMAAADTLEKGPDTEDANAHVDEVPDEVEEGVPDLHTGELIVRQAGLMQTQVKAAHSFAELDTDDSIKSAISMKGWSSMSKIQQIGLPIILSNPPYHLVAQAQAGTGKTGTFVIGMLSRVTNDIRPSCPQGIILAGTQELVNQIAGVVNELGECFRSMRAPV
jgi:hypothetical protein